MGCFAKRTLESVTAYSSSSKVRNITGSATSVHQSYQPPEAVLAFHKYQELHSHEALNRDYIDSDEGRTLQHRKYAVAYYWCPQRMGNILHSFFNAFTWAMIHNRTILWKYHDTDNISSEAECQAILERASWLPSFDEWYDRLFRNDEQQEVFLPVDLVDFNKTQSYPLVLYPQIPDVLAENSNIVRNGWTEDPSHSRYRDYLHSLPTPFQTVAVQLYSEGKEFLYGMLYSEIFTLKIPVKEAVFGHNLNEQSQSEAFSVGLHSRHPVGADDGSYISQETDCLNRMISLAKKQSDFKQCNVYIMSDRRKTVDLLIAWLVDRNCTATIANHTSGPWIDDIPEHGPWSGAGFLLDLQVVGEAQNAAVGDPHRSSTALVFNLVEYNRRMKALEQGDTHSDEKIPICELPNKPLSGYTYGQGSPTFRHRSHLDPLPPIGVMDIFKSQNRSASRRQGRYIVSFFDFEMAAPEAVYGVLNSTCDQPCVKERYSLAAKAWLDNGFSDTVKFDNAVPKLRFGSENVQSSMVDEEVLQLDFDKFHFSLAEWTNMICAEHPCQLNTLKKMFAQGGRFLYGLLFHETFDILERISPPWLEPPSTTIAVYLETGARADDIEKCVASMLPEPLHFTPIAEQCHVLLLVKAHELDAKVSNFSSQRCSFSPVPVPSSALTNRDWWRAVDLASSVRSGWIAPFNSSSAPTTASLIGERIEYYRHRETWILGRDPFYIPKLQECIYPCQ
eukprot:scaffold1736_cov127-Cylindrotheca_fusiformis.AAC.106